MQSRPHCPTSGGSRGKVESLLETVAQLKQALTSLQLSNSLVDYNEPPSPTIETGVDYSSPLLPEQARADTEISELRKQLADTRNACLIASEDANRWNLLAVERLAEIGRLEALSSLVDKGKPPVNQTTLQGNDESRLLDVASEPLEKEAVEVEEPATGEPEEEAIAGEPEEVSSLPVAAGEPLEPLTSLGLGKRLKKNNSSVSRNKDKGNAYFREWSAKLDPDGIAWEFRKGEPRSAQFHPLV